MSCDNHMTCLGRGGGPSPGPSNKLFVRNLWKQTEVSTLQEYFPEANDIYLPKDRETGEKRGYVGRGRNMREAHEVFGVRSVLVRRGSCVSAGLGSSRLMMLELLRKLSSWMAPILMDSILA